MKRLPSTVLAVAAAVLLAGCGEITNTLAPQPGTENLVTVALDSSPNFTHVGIFEAQALGYFRQTDLKVRFITSADPLKAIQSGQAQIAIASEPAIILVRNTHISLASVASLVHGPQRVQVSCASAKTTAGAGKSTSAKRAAGTQATTATTSTTGAKSTTGATAATGATSTTSAAATTGTTASTTPRSHAPLHPASCTAKVIAQPESRYAKAPTYDALDFAVTQDEIVNHAPILRRFIQAVGRGYTAARSDPQSATENLVKLNPSLHYTEQLAGVRASMASFFPTNTPTTDHPWGTQTVSKWNAFGTWMLTHHVISDYDAIQDADTNELLAGQGV